ncbi:hypothetical protein GCM10011504_46410 [Siccirubricoccus deserti]|nr:hypothetical protein GCM10011504_46410 [Siccirubricoccus deserti]
MAEAEAALAQLDPAARRNEVPATVAAMLQLARLQFTEARAGFEAVLRQYPESVSARIGLARVGLTQGTEGEPERLLGEVLRRQPAQPEALSRLTALATSGGPRAVTARVALTAAQEASPGEPALALALAQVLQDAGDAAGAVAVLETEPLLTPGRGAALPLARARAYAAMEKWSEAEAASRAALAESPENAVARRQLASLLVRGGDPRGAEALLREGLRSRPADPMLQQGLIGLVNETRGLDAALAVADQLAQQPEAQPNGRLLRGDLLLASRRPADAARAYAAAHAAAPSAGLALRTAGAWLAADQRAEAEKVLNAWLQRVPEEVEVLNTLAQFDIQAGRTPQAVQRLTTLLQRAPNNAVALNNLAWLTSQEPNPAALERARELSERAYFLLPSPETADTLGWILARLGQTQRALPLLRAAVSASRRNSAPDFGGAYRLAFTLRAAGERAEAQRIIDQVLANGGAFRERPEAERLQAELRAGR